MKLWCLLVLYLIFTTSASSNYMNDYDNTLINYSNVENLPLISQPSDFSQEDLSKRSSIVKRSQRNANILYRYCRRNGQAPNFCLKYAVRMIFATGH